MDIVFQVEKVKNEIVDVKTLFPSADTTYHQTGLGTIIKTLKSLVEKLNTDEDREIFFPALYAGSFEFNDVLNEREQFYIVVRMVKNYPDKILRVGERKYEFDDTVDLLNSENKDETISYKVFGVRGELK